MRVSPGSVDEVPPGAPRARVLQAANHDVGDGGEELHRGLGVVLDHAPDGLDGQLEHLDRARRPRRRRVDSGFQEPGLAEGVARSEDDHGPAGIAALDPHLDLTRNDEPELETFVARDKEGFAEGVAPVFGDFGQHVEGRLIETAEDLAVLQHLDGVVHVARLRRPR